MTDVCLVSMPYSAIERPSIALGILQACLQRVGIDATSIYGTVLFAEKIGLDKYTVIDSSQTEDLLGEWTFSDSAFPDFHPDHQAFFTLIPSRSDALIDLLWEIRAQAGLFIDQLAEEILALQPRIVGCTSTFQQNCASLALLRRIKTLAPEVITMMGGANCESTMGVTIQKEFPWVDYVVSGEADELIGDFCHQLLQHGKTLDPAQLPYGVIGGSLRRPSRDLSVLRSKQPPRAVVKNLNNSPAPFYDDYFATLSQSSFEHAVIPGLLAETSRGCWWGQKHHCTFCGLNGLGMGYRSKSPDRVVQELAELVDHYKIRTLAVVDNILDMSYMDTVIPRLSLLEDKYILFFETKANLKRAQVRQLAEAGVLWLQPGIESLHDEFLKLINKGTTALINLQMMKWCREYGITLGWNILVEAPGERDEWYVEMAKWLPMVFHLPPPQGAIRIRYDRFSQYFIQPEKYGIHLTPFKGYAYVYPVSEATLFDLAYYFEDDNNKKGRQSRPGLLLFEIRIQQWMHLFQQKKPPVLTMADKGRSLRITDTRPCATQELHTLEGLACEVYRACDGATSANALIDVLQTVQPGILWEDIVPVIKQLKQDKLLLELNGKFFSLAIRENIPSLLEEKYGPGGYVDATATAYAKSVLART